MYFTNLKDNYKYNDIKEISIFTNFQKMNEILVYMYVAIVYMYMSGFMHSRIH